jgi:hypothetical protein
MTQLVRSNFQNHPFHLVSPSPWPLYTSLSLLSLTMSGALSMHSFSNSSNVFILALVLVASAMSFWFRDIIAEGTFLGNHTLAVQKGLNLGVILFIVSEGLFFLAIFWAFFHKALWIEAKLRGHPKALITKPFKEIFKVALLMIKGIVISLEIIGINQWMGNRGSKSDSPISVKEQRVDGFSISSRYCKVYSKCQGNLVFMQHNNVLFNKKMYFQNFYSRSQYSTFSSKALSSELNPYYITGFTDGEGCFFIGVSPDTKYKAGFRVKAIFQIGIHIKDMDLLNKIKLYFNVGGITRLGEESIQYRVSALKDLNVIIDHYEKYPLLTYKQSDFLLFKEVVELIKQGKHLTSEGLNKIISIKASLNSQTISDKLRQSFPQIIPALISKTQDKKIKSLHWLAGFTDAEGCFFIAIKKSQLSKLGETVWLRFILTQHLRDKELIESLMSTLSCGRYITKSGYGEFIVEKFSDINEKILPIFEKFQLHGIKSKEFYDFKEAALIIKNKGHLTRKGLDEIKKIKGKMNRNRKY